MGSTSVFLCPHSGHVISELSEVFVLLSFAQQASLWVLSVSLFTVSEEHDMKSNAIESVTNFKQFILVGFCKSTMLRFILFKVAVFISPELFLFVFTKI